MNSLLLTLGGSLLIVGIASSALVSCARRSGFVRLLAAGTRAMPDVWIARLGLTFLGMIGIVALVIMGIVTSEGREIPPAIAGLGGSAASTLGVVVIALIRTTNGKNPPSAQL